MIYYPLIIRVAIMITFIHTIQQYFFKNGISKVNLRGSENKPLPPNYYLAKPFYKPVRKSDYSIGHIQQYSSLKKQT